MKDYKIERIRDGEVIATVIAETGPDASIRYNLPHLSHHSPDGFEFGYGGSGPADLARSIVGDFMETDNPEPRIYQQVKAVFIAPLEGDGPHTIAGVEIQHLLDECCP